MEPTFIREFVEPGTIYETLRTEVPWVNRDAPRDECFMAVVARHKFVPRKHSRYCGRCGEEESHPVHGDPTTYSYGNNNELRTKLHTYEAVPMHPVVKELLDLLNRTFDAQYNVCVLNYYKDQHQHLGWHADDSPEQDLQHPIAVITFGASRYIWTRKKGEKGAVPDSQKFLLSPGSLFIMPGGYQDEHQHRIPKHDRECGGRISLTFRKLDR